MSASPIEDGLLFLSTLTASLGERRLAVAVLLPQTDAKGAGALAERIRRAVAALEIRNQASRCDHVTVSIGVADVRPDWSDDRPESPRSEALNGQALTAMADALLYSAKSSGRNRVAIKETIV